jgi:hypothetical protein
MPASLPGDGRQILPGFSSVPSALNWRRLGSPAHFLTGKPTAAAVPLATLGRTRKRLEETGRPVLARVLVFLEEQVFGKGTDAVAAAAAVGSTTASISPRIEVHTGYSLDDLIARVRFETAVNMKAVDPELSVERLSEVLGLSEWRLRRLFEKWPDEAPPGKRRRKRAFDPRSAATCDLAARGKQAHQLKAEGHAWLGNARRLALNFLGAERELKKALGVLDTHKELKGSLTDGIVHFIFGNLRLFEQDYDEALNQFDYALNVFECLEDLS